MTKVPCKAVLAAKIAKDIASDEAMFVGELPFCTISGRREISEVEIFDPNNRSEEYLGEYDGVLLKLSSPVPSRIQTKYASFWNADKSPVWKDSFSRIFTIHAMAMPLSGESIIDPTGRGLDDCINGVIDTVLPHHVAIRENPWLMTAAIRLASVYDFKIDSKLVEFIRANSGIISKLDPVRFEVDRVITLAADKNGLSKELGIYGK